MTLFVVHFNINYECMMITHVIISFVDQTVTSIQAYHNYINFGP